MDDRDQYYASLRIGLRSTSFRSMVIMLSDIIELIYGG